MLSRVHIDKETTVLGQTRQDPIQWRVRKQEVCLDPWENNNCLRAMQVAFSTGFQDPDWRGWRHIPCNISSIWQGNKGQFMVRVLDDLDAGFVYYRRPIDMERQMIWNGNKDFRIEAGQWWDNEEQNTWWKENYPGLWWFVELGAFSEGDASLPSRIVVETASLDSAKKKIADRIRIDSRDIPSVIGPFDNEYCQGEPIPI